MSSSPETQWSAWPEELSNIDADARVGHGVIVQQGCPLSESGCNWINKDEDVVWIVGGVTPSRADPLITAWQFVPCVRSQRCD